MGTLKGMNAFVSGAEQGIGYAIVSQLINEGCNVYFHYHSDESGPRSLLKQAELAGVKANYSYADLTSEIETQDCVGKAIDFLGGVNILVNNVGGLVGRKKLGEIDKVFLNEVFDRNITTMLNVTQMMLPYLLNKTSGSSIVNIASLAGRTGGHEGSLVYSAAKGAVLTWTRSLATELGPHGIRINAVAPGFILGTRFHRNHTSDSSSELTIKTIPLARAGQPEDVARAVVFLSSEYDGFIDGATLDINGGVYCV